MKLRWKKIDGLEKPEGIILIKKKLSARKLKKLKREWSRLYCIENAGREDEA